MQLSSAFCYFLQPSSKYFTCHPVLEHPPASIKTPVTPANAQFYSLCILSINWLLRVSALSTFSGSLHQHFFKTCSNKQFTLSARLLRCQECAVCSTLLYTYTYRCKGKAVPLQAWSGPEGSRKLRPPDFVTQDGGRLSALRTGRLYPQKILLVLISVRG